jgi:hypothetical protein
VAARTAAPDAPATTPISPNRDPEGPPSPVLAWPSEWPVPQPPEQPRQTRGRNGRGLPMAPTLAAAGNATSLLATGAYAAGGVVGVAATGALAAAGATAAVVRRRKTVRRNMASRRMAPPSIAGLHSGGASRGASRGGSGLGLLGAPGRSGGGSRGASGGGSTDSAYRRSGRPAGGSARLRPRTPRRRQLGLLGPARRSCAVPPLTASGPCWLPHGRGCGSAPGVRR